MTCKTRFPLKMKNGAEVHTLGELKENFDLESVLGYFTDGKLTTWLSDRYYDEKAEAVAALSAELNSKLCEILEVDYHAEEDTTDLEYIQKQNEKYRILSAATLDQDILNNIDIVAMNQDELYDVLDKESDKVYLYGKQFEIPFGRKNVCYTGVNRPLVLLGKDKTIYDFEKSGITFSNVEFEESLLKKHYPDPVGEFEIENGILKNGKPDANGVCIIPDSVTSIGRYAFNFCKSLTSITIPDSVTSIEDCAFSDCYNLTSINVSKNNLYYSSIDGVLFNKERTKLIQYPACKTETKYTILDSVTSIGSHAFSNCKSLTSVTIPDSVTSIEDRAFSGCERLTSVTIPDSVTSIGQYAFNFCKSLTSITIPDSVTSIEDCAFIIVRELIQSI